MTPEIPDGFPIPKETRPWICRRGLTDCTRKVPCPACRGARNARSGKRKQRAGRKPIERATGTIAARFVGQLGNEESWTGLPFRVEVKSGAQVKPIWTRYIAAERQAEAAHAIGDPRPFMFVAMPPGSTDGLVVFRLSNLERILGAFD